MKKGIVFVLAMLACCLSGCGRKITEGEIYSKEFIEEDTWTQLVPMVHTGGKTVYTTLIPIVHHHPDEYVISIRDLESDKTADYYVESEVYDECEIGMMFKYEPERGDLDEEPIEKRRKTNDTNKTKTPEGSN